MSKAKGDLSSRAKIDQAACDHKFIDSNRCLKCGWTPTPGPTPRNEALAAGGRRQEPPGTACVGLPPNLAFVVGHPAASAYRITLSPHEWTWTNPEMQAIARALVQRDSQLLRLLKVVRGAVHGLRSYEHGNASPDLASELAESILQTVVDIENGKTSWTEKEAA